MEAIILCLMGGAVGLFFVWIGTIISSKALDFPIYISTPMLVISVVVCVVVGIIAGIFPASRAAKMDPVVAIRS
jgi:putative ABC transport system permease protein